MKKILANEAVIGLFIRRTSLCEAIVSVRRRWATSSLTASRWYSNQIKEYTRRIRRTRSREARSARLVAAFIQEMFSLVDISLGQMSLHPRPNVDSLAFNSSYGFNGISSLGGLLFLERKSADSTRARNYVNWKKRRPFCGMLHVNPGITRACHKGDDKTVSLDKWTLRASRETEWILRVFCPVAGWK